MTAERSPPRRGAPEFGGALNAARPARTRGSVLRTLAGVRRRVIGLRRAMIADRPAPGLLRRIRAIRADLRSVERRLVLDHARRSVEEALPGDRHAGTRRELLELLESYPHGRGVDRV